MAEWLNERNESQPSKNETPGGRANEASEADVAEKRPDEGAAAGWGGAKNSGRTGRGTGGRVHAGVRRISCAKRTKMSKLKTREHDGAAVPTRPRG